MMAGQDATTQLSHQFKILPLLLVQLIDLQTGYQQEQAFKYIVLKSNLTLKQPILRQAEA